jgi:hypothetical protein
MSAPMRADIKPVPAANLWHIARTGDPDQLAQALSRGADINACNGSGTTPLMVAAYHGRAEMVRALVANGAQPNAVDGDGFTAAMLADQAGHDEVVKALVSLGVKKKRPGNAPQPHALHFAEPDTIEAADDFDELVDSKNPAVKTLSEPPEIWDLVHETHTEFKPGTDFFGHLKSTRSLVLIGLMLLVGVGVAFALMKFRGFSVSNSSGPTVQTRESNSSRKSEPVVPIRSASDQPSFVGENAKNDRTSKAPTEFALRQHFTGVSSGSNGVRDESAAEFGPQAVVKTRRENATKLARGQNTADKRPMLDANEDVTESTTRVDNRKKVQLSKSEKQSPPKPAGEQAASPPNPNATPKPKVIPWP